MKRRDGMYQGPPFKGEDPFNWIGVIVCVCGLLIIFNMAFELLDAEFAENPGTSKQTEVVELKDGTVCVVKKKKQIHCGEPKKEAEEFFRDSNPPPLK